MRYKLLALFLLAATVGTATVSATHFDDPSTIDRLQTIPTNISNDTQLAVLISLWDEDGNPVSPQDCDSLGVQYNYNAPYPGQGGGTNMTYIEGTQNRYYAVFPVDTRATTIDFYAAGEMWGSDCNSPLDYVHNNITINPRRNLSVQLLNATPNDRFLEGESYSLWTNVTYNDSFQNGSVVNWSLHDPNGSIVQEGHFTNWTGTGRQDRYNTTLQFPPATEGRYFLNITAHTPEAGFVNATGGLSRTFILNDRLEGSEQLLVRTDTCGLTGGTLECQKGTDFALFYNVSKTITHVRPDTVLAWASGNSRNYTTVTLENPRDRDWFGTTNISKDFNTSRYGTSLDLTMVAKNSLSRDSAVRTIQISPFALNIGLQPLNKYQGDTIEFRIAPRHKYTNEPLDRQKIDTFKVTVYNWTGGKVFNQTLGENGTAIPDSNYDSDQNLFNTSWDTAEDVPNGTYTWVIEVTDIYGATKLKSDQFEIYDESEQEVSSVIALIGGEEQYEIEHRYTDTGLRRYTDITLENNGSLAASVTNMSVSGDLVNITNVSISQDGTAVEPPFELAGGASASVDVNVSLEEYGIHRGAIAFNISSDLKNYTVTLDFNLTVKQDRIPCPFRDKTLCTYEDRIEERFTAKGNHQLTVDVGNRGANDTNVTLGVTGDLADLLIENSTNQTMIVDNGSIGQFALNLSASSSINGFYAGNISITGNNNTSFRIPANVTIDVPRASFDITVLELQTSTLIKGQDNLVFTTEINNTGNLSITNLTLTVEPFGIEKELRNTTTGNYTTLAPGETANTTVDAATTDFAAGTYTMENNNAALVTVTAAGGASADDTVDLIIVKAIGDDISDLTSEVSTLNDSIQGLSNVSAGTMDDLRQKFQNYRQAINAAEEAWNNGNYQTAEDEYNTASTLKTELENDIEQARQAGGGGNGGDDTNETNGGNGGGGNGGGGDSGGGFNLLFLIIPLIILIIIGVVIYLSIVPEEEAGETEGGMDFGPPQ